MNHAFDTNSLLIPDHKDFLFFKKYFIVLHFTCKSLMPLELIFVKVVRCTLRFLFAGGGVAMTV